LQMLILPFTINSWFKSCVLPFLYRGIIGVEWLGKARPNLFRLKI
jgi:hypothetical protein